MEKTLPAIFSLENFVVPTNVLVIGCGGTGAYVISHLTRLISCMEERRRPKLYIADGDIVEERNLSRQHFILQDVGRNKAEVLAERYSAAFGLTIDAICKNIEKREDFPTLNTNSQLIIGCVDNNASRQLIHNTFFSGSSNMRTFWVDSGNEERYGQVVCGHNLGRYAYGYEIINVLHNKRKIYRGVFSLPCVTEIYPELLEKESKFNSELSCAERAISAPQNMMTNVTAATIVMNYAQACLMCLPITSHAVEFSIKNVFTTRLNTVENLSTINPNRKSGVENDSYY